MIRGFFDPAHSAPVPKVWLGLALRDIAPRWTAIDFVVDTGASVTCLHQHDATERVGLTPDEIARIFRSAHIDRSISGITGPTLYAVVPAQYLLLHEDGSHQVENGPIRVGQPLPATEALPSVLGWDILEQFRIVIDRRTGEVQLQ